jgi:hypothetical protein
MATAQIKRADDPRPTPCGSGVVSARERSTAEFSAVFKQASSDNGRARERRRNQAERRKAEKEADGTAAAERAKLQAAKDAWAARAATPEQMKLVRKHEKALDFVKLRMAMQPAHERIHEGFEWQGGWVVEDKIWRDPFVQTGLRTWRHPFYQRVLASMGKASRGDLRTGDTKDSCIRQFSKLHGSDKLYGFFSVRCRDMWRLDCDEEFASEAHMLSWLAFRVIEGGAPCMPHMAVWIPDSRFPGRISKPHFLFFLPERRAVWPNAPDSHHRLLKRVISALTEAFDCDEGGLAHPFHGKNPISPLSEAIVIQDTHMPALDEYADAMNLSWEPEMMFRKMTVEKMEQAGFDAGQSNTWFSVPSTLANAVSHQLHRDGFNVADEDAFQAAIAAAIAPEVRDLIKPSTEKQISTVDRMIGNCARWSARMFDPSKADAPNRDRGAIAHLIEPTDDIKTRRQKGQTYVAQRRTRATQTVLKPVYRERIKRKGDHSRTVVAKATGLCYNTIKRHEFEVYIDALSELLVPFCSLVSVKEVHPVLTTNILPFESLAARSGHSPGLRPPDSPPPDPVSDAPVHVTTAIQARPLVAGGPSRR